MLHDRLEPEFVEFVPEALGPSVLYISMRYATASHLCACGRREKVVTPFTRTDWRMTFAGETVSLSPSVGSWEQGCFTHYLIDRNCIIEHGPWTPEQIEQGRRSEGPILWACRAVARAGRYAVSASKARFWGFARTIVPRMSSRDAAAACDWPPAPGASVAHRTIQTPSFRKSPCV